MAYHNYKPLPSVPEIHYIYGLCVESSSLITTLLRQAIAEEGLEDDWCELVRKALCDFGRYVESKKTLYLGIRSSRKELKEDKFERLFAGAYSGQSHRQTQQDTTITGKAANLKAIELDSVSSGKPVLSTESKMEQIRHCILTQTSSESLSPMHLLVAVATSKNWPGRLDSSQDDTPVIVFEEETFHFPSQDHEADSSGIIYGLENWQSDPHSAYIIGGTFVLKDIPSEHTFDSLLSILRLSLYVYLSLVLEQSLLRDFHVTLQYPSWAPVVPRSPQKAPAEVSSIPDELAPTILNPKSTPNKPGNSSIWSYISRKTETIIHRVSASSHSRMEENPVHGRVVPHLIDSDEIIAMDPSQTVDSDTKSRQKDNPSGASDSPERGGQVGAFTATVQRLNEPTCILSTSLQVRFPPPPLVLQLASREQEQKTLEVGPSINSSTSSSFLGTATTANNNSKITGVEKTGLASIIGWENREARGKGMSGVKGFIRQQGLTVLYRKHRRTGTGSLERLCGKPLCITYRYYSRHGNNDADPDFSLGEFIESLCNKDSLSQKCLMEGCGSSLQDHVHSWTFDSVIIEGHLNKKNSHFGTADEGITVWQSCFICEQETLPSKMDDRTYLFSFAKFLEVLVWSPMIRSMPLCSHIDPSKSKYPGQLDARDGPYNVVYHFLYNDQTLSLYLRSIRTSIFELQLPRLQLASASNTKEDRCFNKSKCDDEKETLETQIEQWWQGTYTRIHRLDEFLEKLTETNKDLPPLPSSDDEGEEEGEEGEEEEETNKGVSMSSSANNVGPLPRPVPLHSSSNNFPSFSSGYTLWNNLKNFGRTVPYPPSLPFRAIESRILLAKLKESFRLSEALLKSQLAHTPLSSLNDVRRKFRYSAQAISNRLSAWQKKHVPGAPENLVDGDCIIKEPEWWNNGCHAVPGGRVLVREAESGSIIAFTLSSLSYQRELVSLHSPSGHPSSKQYDSEASPGRASLPSNPLNKATGSSIALPDPDIDDIALWSQPEPCITTVTRCEHPREESLLGLRDVLRTTNSSDSSSFNSRFTGSISRGTSAIIPPSAWAQPQVQVSLNAADGELTQLGPKGPTELKVSQSPQSSYATSSSSLREPQEHHRNTERSPGLQIMKSGDGTHGILSLAASQPVPITPNRHVSGLGASTPTQSSSLTETLTNTMRYLFTSESKSPSRTPSPAPPSSTLHGLIAYGSLYSMDEQPHIRYECTIGNRVQFRCTVYYAKQFDIIRKRCGVDTDIIKSLQRSENWLAVGGKSKSNFWRSLDERFIIKTLVNAWNVADLQVLIELAPSYFRYIESTATKASTLAKLMGFYTVEVKNMETGVIQTKHDVLVMENLFYEREISRTYDLKGIASRRVKTKGEQSRDKPFYDSEWIEAQERTPLFLRGHSGYILREGLRADAEFLAKSNITDYSLLLGVDEVNSQIPCGLVDTIGSYTFAKTLEYKAKHNLISAKGKETTVIPPMEYQRRFLSSLETYFLICPDKWTKPQHYIDRTRAYELPDIL